MEKQTALVTGASAGMGKAIARRLIADGYEVYGAARRLDQMRDLEAAGGHALPVDLTDTASIDACVDTVQARRGGIDVLVNNAGYGCFGAIEDVPIVEARRQFDVNLFGLAHLIRLVVPAMRAHKGGYIFNVSSIGGKIHTPFGGWYHATKHALEGFSDCLRLELAPFGIHVVVIEPGTIKTEWSGIASEGLRRTSGGGAYAAPAQAAARLMEKRRGQASDPEVIADTISSALRAKAPRTRYAVGKGARVALSLRRLLSDRALDGMWLRMMRG